MRTQLHITPFFDHKVLQGMLTSVLLSIRVHICNVNFQTPWNFKLLLFDLNYCLHNFTVFFNSHVFLFSLHVCNDKALTFHIFAGANKS